MQDDSTRWCSHCQRNLPLSAHYKKPRAWCKACTRKAQRYSHDPRKALKQRLWRDYKLTIQEYEGMVFEQMGVCPICGEWPQLVRGQRLHVDHDHQSGKVRDLLCHACNAGLGNFRDDPERLRSAIEYLKKWSL